MKGIPIPTILPSQIPLVPFPGIFSTYIGAHLSKRQFCLRPLSRGPFFNKAEIDALNAKMDTFSSPFLGTFFQWEFARTFNQWCVAFSSPFLGTFFQYGMPINIETAEKIVSSPFLGTFFQCILGNVLLR